MTKSYTENVVKGIRDHTTANVEIDRSGSCFDRTTKKLELHILPPLETPTTMKMKAMHPELEGHPIMVNAFRAVADGREFFVGFGVWSDEGPTTVCGAVIERIMAETPGDKQFTIRLISNEKSAFKRTDRTLRGFRGKTLLIACRDEDVLCAAMSRMWDDLSMVIGMKK